MSHCWITEHKGPGSPRDPGLSAAGRDRCYWLQRLGIMECRVAREVRPNHLMVSSILSMPPPRYSLNERLLAISALARRESPGCDLKVPLNCEHVPLIGVTIPRAGAQFVAAELVVGKEVAGLVAILVLDEIPAHRIPLRLIVPRYMEMDPFESCHHPIAI